MCMNVGPMLNGDNKGKLTGSGTIVWEGRQMHAVGEIDGYQLVDFVAKRLVQRIDRFFGEFKTKPSQADTFIAPHLLVTATLWELHQP